MILNVINEYKITQHYLVILENNIRDNYDDLIKSEIETTLTMIDTLRKDYEDKSVPNEEIKKLIASVIRDLRYGEDGYFWIDTSKGDNVVLYASEVEGTNRYNFKDAKGNYVVQEIIDIALHGGGFIDYYYPRAGESLALPKRAYGEYYEAFDWVIGTGIYTDSIDRIINTKKAEYVVYMNEHVMKHIIFLSIFLTIIIFLNFIMIKSLVEPILFITSYAEAISKKIYNLKIPLNFLQRKDEVGRLVISISKMQKSIIDVMEKKEKVNDQLTKEKEFLNTILSSIGDGIIVTDNEGIIQIANDATLIQLEIAKEDIIGKVLIEKFRFNNENNKEMEKIENLRLLTNSKVNTRRECILSAYGKVMYVEDSMFPIINRLEDSDGFIYVFRNINDKLEKQKEIDFLNYHDQLTGLYNRRYFEKETDRILEKQIFPFTLIIADINALKLTNDAFGHLIGDELIKTFADTLHDCFSTIGTVARIGGDEFAVLLPNIDKRIATDKIINMKSILSNFKNKIIHPSASFGVAVHRDETYSYASTFNIADERMYQEKLLENDKIKEKILKSIIRYNYSLFPGKIYEVQRSIRFIKAFAKKLNLDEDVTKKLRKSALVYDIGNVNIKYEYFTKTSKLNEKEMIEIKAHPITAYHILKNINKVEDVANIVLSHHENYDGTGYPKGISGIQIHLESRILALVTDYCAMTSERSYRKMLTTEEAINEIYINTGLRYDPELSEPFIRMIRNPDL